MICEKCGNEKICEHIGANENRWICESCLSQTQPWLNKFKSDDEILAGPILFTRKENKLDHEVPSDE